MKQKVCKRCGRMGVRQFSPAPSGGYVCFSLAACERRQHQAMTPSWYTKVRDSLVLIAHHVGYRERDLAGLPDYIREYWRAPVEEKDGGQ